MGSKSSTHTAVNTPRKKKTVAPICHISDECFGLIAGYCDVNLLWLTGNAAIHSKLLRSVEKFEVELGALQKYPISAFLYPRLRSFKVTCLVKSVALPCYMPYWVKDDILVPLEGHQTLESLEIEGSLAMTLLHSSTTRPSLDTLLPRLTTLKLLGDGHLSQDCLKNVPQTVTELVIAHSSYTEHDACPTLPVDALSDLPRTIEKLILSGITIQIVTSQNLDSANDYFPSSLTHLEIQCASIEAVISLVPGTLQIFAIATPPPRGTSVPEILKTSFLERFVGLTSFTFHQGDSRKLTTVFDRPFPRNLKTLTLPGENLHQLQENATFSEETWHAILPRSLTTFEGYLAYHSTIDWCNTLPHLIHAHIESTVLLKPKFSMNWPPLVSIALPQRKLTDENIMSLPHTLTKLAALIDHRPLWLEKLSNLKQLSFLSLHDPIDSRPPNGFWSLAHERLASIRFNIKHCDSIENVCGDWKRLEEIDFIVPDERAISQEIKNELKHYSTIQSSPKMKLFRYPSTLRTFKSHIGARASFFSHSLEYLTLLRTVKVRCPALPSVGLPKTEAALQILTRLPDFITSLTISVHEELDPFYLWHLPKSITHLWVYSLYPEFIWELEHLRSLPPNLVHLTLLGDYELISRQEYRLPSKTCYFYSYSDPKTIASNEAKRQRLVGTN